MSCRLIALILVSVGMAASAAADEADEAADGGEGGIVQNEIPLDGLKNACFFTREVNNWEAVNRTQLIVYAPTKSRAYLVTIAPPSTSLRFTSTIGFGGRTRICGRTGERLVLATGMNKRHAIMDVRRMDADALAAYQGRLEADGAPVTPSESPGAEVEEDIQPEAE